MCNITLCVFPSSFVAQLPKITWRSDHLGSPAMVNSRRGYGRSYRPPTFTLPRLDFSCTVLTLKLALRSRSSGMFLPRYPSNTFFVPWLTLYPPRLSPVQQSRSMGLVTRMVIIFPRGAGSAAQINLVAHVRRSLIKFLDVWSLNIDNNMFVSITSTMLAL